MSIPFVPVIETTHGRYFDYENPKAKDVSLTDLAIALSNTCRFGGFVNEFYSVAEHACLVRRLAAELGADSRLQLAALHHDSHEAYLGDVPSPLKPLLKPAYEELVARVDEAIAERFGFDPALFDDPIIKQADAEALRIEAYELKHSRGVDSPYWPWAEAPMTPHWWQVVGDPVIARLTFIGMHYDVLDAIHQNALANA